MTPWYVTLAIDLLRVPAEWLAARIEDSLARRRERIGQDSADRTAAETFVWLVQHNRPVPPETLEAARRWISRRR